MTEIQAGDGEPFEVTDVEIDHTPDTATHLSFGERKIRDTRIDFPATKMDPETAKLMFGGPVRQPTSSVTVEIPGKRYWWKPWRRRPGRTLHFNAVAVWPWPGGEADA